MADTPTESQVIEALKQVKWPGFSRDIVSFGIVKDIQIQGRALRVTMKITSRDAAIPRQIEADSREALGRLAGLDSVEVIMDAVEAKPIPDSGGAGAAALKANPIPGVKHIIAIASGKGGVGKSTVSSNLACALVIQGYKVGLLDCDLYGPSVALMFGTRERPYANDAEQIIPIEQYGLKLMSMGFLLEDTSPVILRGPRVTAYTQQFLKQVDWGDLDFLILDLPPGTGDIQLTIVQTVSLSGAVIVTTPQEVALIDARKAASMFEKVNVPVLGLVENMSYFISPTDGERFEIFGSGGGEREARRLKVPLLGKVPIEMVTREAGDRGKPLVLHQVDSAGAKIFLDIATQIAGFVNA
jgi:ATP-binding protein involved in chromosome partitioning